MSIRRLEYLLADVRDESDNPNSKDTKDGTIVQYFNRAQDRLMSKITLKDETFLSKYSFIDLVADQISYTLPTDMFATNRIISVEWSLDNTTLVNRRVYTKLKKIVPGEQNHLIGYFIQQNNLIISPVPTKPTSGGLRINYFRKPNRLDIRRGVITSLSPLTITALGDTATYGLQDDLLSIVDDTGSVLVTNIANGGYNSGTGVITTTSSLSGASVGNYVLLGGSSTTHCELPDLAERYLIEYAKLMMFHKDSSADVAAQSQILQSLEEDILDLFSNNSMDEDYVPVVNTDYMGYD